MYATAMRGQRREVMPHMPIPIRKKTIVSRFKPSEKKLILGISLVMGIRMLGVSMILPVFSIFATELPHSTETLAGLAVGIFGIVQIILQIPIGRLSDRWGRKQVTLAGLVVYFAGSIFSGLSKNICHLITARAVSGAGAINGVTMAWLADGIAEDKRSAALSYVGISMGLAVICGFTLSPIIAAKMGIPFLFYTCALLIFITILYTLFNLKNHDEGMIIDNDIKTENLRQILGNTDLMRLNIIGFVGNLNLNSVFFIIPLLLNRSMGLADMWKIYIPASLLGTAMMFYFGRKADIVGTRKIAALGILFELAAVIPALFDSGPGALVVTFSLFYCGHCILSPVLPAAVSRYPNPQLKGTVMSVFNSSQFLGSGVGGLLSGIILALDPRFVFVAIGIFSCMALASLARYSGFRRTGA